MKTAKIFLSIILVACLISGFALPAFAVNQSKDVARSIPFDELNSFYFKNEKKHLSNLRKKQAKIIQNSAIYVLSLTS